MRSEFSFPFAQVAILFKFMQGEIMNLAVISLAIIGMLVTAYAIVYSLVCDDSVSLPVRMLSLIILIGGYVGIIAIIMVIVGMPLS